MGGENYQRSSWRNIAPHSHRNHVILDTETDPPSRRPYSLLFVCGDTLVWGSDTGDALQYLFFMLVKYEVLVPGRIAWGVTCETTQ